MLLAEIEVWHSRSIAPTRRVALGHSSLPVSPPPGWGGLLLGGIVAVASPELDDELRAELADLLVDLEAGRPIPQPRLRHRFQLDRHGLARTTHHLLGGGDALRIESSGGGSAASQALAASYAAGQLPLAARRPVFALLRRGLRWRGPCGPSLFAYLSGGGSAFPWSPGAHGDPTRWAVGVLGLDLGPGLEGLGRGPGRVPSPARREVQRAFRTLLREAHPDHGADTDVAASRIADLREARRILLAIPPLAEAGTVRPRA